MMEGKIKQVCKKAILLSLSSISCQPVIKSEKENVEKTIG